MRGLLPGNPSGGPGPHQTYTEVADGADQSTENLQHWTGLREQLASNTWTIRPNLEDWLVAVLKPGLPSFKHSDSSIILSLCLDIQVDSLPSLIKPQYWCI